MDTGMSARELPSGRDFRNRLHLASGLLSAASTSVIAAYLYALLRLTREQWIGFFWVVAALFPVLFVALSVSHRRHWLPIVRCLDLRRTRPLERDELEVGFAAASNPALRTLITRRCLVGARRLSRRASCACVEAIGWAGFSTMLAARPPAASLMCVFHYFMVKRLTQPMRNVLAGEMGDPGVRGRLVQRVPLNRKLWVSLPASCS
jgi:FtsH-binding integral membrane protein